mgnify:CR=1 FL=1
MPVLNHSSPCISISKIKNIIDCPLFFYIPIQGIRTIINIIFNCCIIEFTEITSPRVFSIIASSSQIAISNISHLLSGITIQIIKFNKNFMSRKFYLNLGVSIPFQTEYPLGKPLNRKGYPVPRIALFMYYETHLKLDYFALKLLSSMCHNTIGFYFVFLLGLGCDINLRPHYKY